MVGWASICHTVTGWLAVVVVVAAVVVAGAVVVVVIAAVVVVVAEAIAAVVIVIEGVVVPLLEADLDWYIAFIATMSYSSGEQAECL